MRRLRARYSGGLTGATPEGLPYSLTLHEGRTTTIGTAECPVLQRASADVLNLR